MAWSIVNDEKHSGITIHKMLPGVDDGPIVSQKKFQYLRTKLAKPLQESYDFGFRLI